MNQKSGSGVDPIDPAPARTGAALVWNHQAGLKRPHSTLCRLDDWFLSLACASGLYQPGASALRLISRNALAYGCGLKPREIRIPRGSNSTLHESAEKSTLGRLVRPRASVTLLPSLAWLYLCQNVDRSVYNRLGKVWRS